MFVLLQPGMPPNKDLLEAFVQIRDNATCEATYPSLFTDRMICAGPHYWFAGPCDVRCL